MTDNINDSESNQELRDVIHDSPLEPRVHSTNQFTGLPEDDLILTNQTSYEEEYTENVDTLPEVSIVDIDRRVHLGLSRVKNIGVIKNEVKSVSVENLIQHPYHQIIYRSRSAEYLENSIERTGHSPVYPIVVVPNGDERYWVISGMVRLDVLIHFGYTEVIVVVYNITDETIVKNLIVDLNKSRVKDGYELLMEFRHYLEMYPQHKGVKGSRYDEIGKEMNMGHERVKNLCILNTFFQGDGDVILINIFSGELSINQVNQLKKVVERYYEKFNSESFEKLCNRHFDFTRLEYGIKYLDIDDDYEFELLESYLLRKMTPQEFNKTLEQWGKVEKRIKDHNESKIPSPELSDTFTTEHAHIILGDNSEVELDNPFGKKIKCIVGSPPYGNKRLNGDNIEEETGHNMNGQEYGEFLANTYRRYIPYMEPDGSIYVIIDDFKLDTGEMACSIEYFVTEMNKRGFYLVSRYIWEKANPMPRSYKGKTMTNSIEFIYRFTLDPLKYYSNPNLFIENELPDGKKFIVQEGCTNHTGDGKTSRGSSYVQSHLKKLRNTLSEQDCIDVIKGNVAHPEDFFRQVDEKRHTSTSPIYLTSILILESTEPEDLCVDIWNGVGNTMVSALLLQREYMGIEKEKNYFDQTVNRLMLTEEMIEQDGRVDFTEIDLAA